MKFDATVGRFLMRQLADFLCDSWLKFDATVGRRLGTLLIVIGILWNHRVAPKLFSERSYWKLPILVLS